MRFRSGAAWLAAVVLAGPAMAQERPFFVIHQEFAKPSLVAEYEAATK